MGRPRKFTEETALSEILTVFQLKGYEAASIDDITKASGLSRASLYGVFGSKEEVFRLTLKMYMTETLLSMNKRVNQESEPLAGIKAWFVSLPASFGSQGCLLTVALAERPNLSTALCQELECYAMELSNQITGVLEQAQKGGKLSRYIGSEFDKVSSKLVGLYFAIAVLSRGLPGTSIAKEAIESTLRAVD